LSPRRRFLFSSYPSTFDAEYKKRENINEERMSGKKKKGHGHDSMLKQVEGIEGWMDGFNMLNNDKGSCGVKN